MSTDYSLPQNYSKDDWGWILWSSMIGVDNGELTFARMRRQLLQLPDNEFEVAKALIHQGWCGTFEDLINAAKELS